ncbi:YfzA family protein [Sporosarcina sp. Te-1]|uniref:YfzA family protein n=1 Tax=Sporosarcina sp. Te-1 TaxID=2818390 RepID=UPI001A9E0BC9|nr:YfzA family protein [Sporosarcina sp. Te-1]QTD43195.1 hypothetical protein J3U78_10845 [Sporosarcina sp. Te-1]
MKPVNRSPLNKWLLIVGGFIAAQLVFIATDGTVLEPNLNNAGTFAKKIADNLFFLDWITLYQNFIYRLLTVLAVLQIAFMAIKDITKLTRTRSRV